VFNRLLARSSLESQRVSDETYAEARRELGLDLIDRAHQRGRLLHHGRHGAERLRR
jgi:hypothetical protein